MDVASNTVGLTSKSTNNEKLKGKLEEQKRVVAIKEKKKDIFLTSSSWRFPRGLLGE